MFTMVSPHKRSSDATADRAVLEGYSRQYQRGDGFWAAEVEQKEDVVRLWFKEWHGLDWVGPDPD